VDNPQRATNLAELLERIRTLYEVTDSEIARRIGVSTSTVSTWKLGQRGNGRGPRADTLRLIAETFPEIPAAEVFSAAGRPVPGAVTKDAEQRLLDYIRELTAEQQAAFEAQLRVTVEHNRSSRS
jgi:transcriptional regulator with XRE-family HTH domain